MLEQQNTTRSDIDPPTQSCYFIGIYSNWIYEIWMTKVRFFRSTVPNGNDSSIYIIQIAFLQLWIREMWHLLFVIRACLLCDLDRLWVLTDTTYF